MRSIIWTVALALCSMSALAQGGNITVSYPIAFPMGDLNDYISKTSFRGINFEFNRQIKPQVSVGLEVGWNVFYQDAGEVQYQDKTVTVTGKQYRYTNSVPILVGAQYWPNSKSKKAAPYVGIGLGTVYSNRSTDLGLYRITNEAWQFALRPEAGFVFKTASGVSPFVGVKYYWPFNSSDLDGQTFLSLNVGIKFSRF
ncbi:outer membrane beta-barrel protein [Paraflavitalea pollutisoli]|uniref:outer membrane beta-barrel protein n=1 Tax=Paraflavitalea pollutisoli TaxID=3034143 RepID=UPI0023ECEE95|nr:outer membrane beta-barrel protein [Paraflavitalea sp. H1-2-19X]